MTDSKCFNGGQNLSRFRIEDRHALTYHTVYSKSASRVIDCETVLFMVTDRVLKEFYRHTGVIFRRNS